MDNLNVYDVNDVNGMMKGMGKMETCYVGVRVHVERREFVYILQLFMK